MNVPRESKRRERVLERRKKRTDSPSRPLIRHGMQIDQEGIRDPWHRKFMTRLLKGKKK
jgi:hypothetical protein